MSLKEINKNKIDWEVIFYYKNLIYVFLGAALATIAMEGFMIPNKFMDGGITGISILLQELLHIDISILIVILSIAFIYLGYLKIGKTFAVQTSLAVLLLSAGLYFIEMNPFTQDKLLIAIFGGIMIGTGAGLVIRGGGALDGLEVVALFTVKKTGFSSSEIIMLFNTLIFLAAAFYFGIETAMYTIITYFTANKATDYVVDGIEEFTSMNIVTANHQEIKELLVNELGKGITVFHGERGFLPGNYSQSTPTEIIVTIVTRLEIKRLEEFIRAIDPKAFIYISTIKEATGGLLKVKN